MIPAWNLQGVIPPVRPGVPGHDRDRSPYRSTLRALVEAMGTSHARLDILEGLLNFRKALHDLGVTVGFQWLDGSFSENVESLEARDPRDVDVVTFLELPAGSDQMAIVAENPLLFDHDHVKQTYKVDSFWEVLGEPIDAPSIQRISYWYSMWSHRRDGMWKGFVEVDLESCQDVEAQEELLQARARLGVIA